MKKRVGLGIISLSLVFIGFLFWNRPETGKSPTTNVMREETKQVISTSSPVQNTPIQNIHPALPKERFVKFRSPKKKDRIPAQLRKGLRLSDQLVVAENVYAIKEKDHRVGMGKIISSLKGTLFIQSETRIPEAANVVYDELKDKYYPLSAVLQVHNADKVRDQLKAMGHQEYYYHSTSQTVFLQSSHEQVLGLYKDLKSQGFEVSLEIIRSHFRPR